MIKIVDSGYGVRLSFDETEVFNHMSLVPFIKSVKAEKKFGVKNGKLTARFDVDGEYTLSDVKTKSCSVKSAHIDFSGYDGDFVKMSVVEEENRLALHFSNATFSAAKLTFLVPPTFPVKFLGKEISKGTTDNLVEKKTGVLSAIFKKPKDTLEYEKSCALSLSDGRRYEFETASLVTLDFNKKAAVSLYFEQLPETIYFYKL